MKWELIASLIWVSVSLVLHSCQVKENADLLQVTADASAEAVNGYPQEPQVSNVAFTSIDIPEIFRATGTASTLETVNVEVVMESGETYYGMVRVGILINDDTNKISSFEISSDLLNAMDLGPSYWIDAYADQAAPAGRLQDCLDYCEENSDRPGWCKAGCWAGIGLKVADKTKGLRKAE